jgi:hypothetical protein
MRVEFYGVFLLTGESEPVAASVKRAAAARIECAVNRVMSCPLRASATVAAVLLRDGEIFTRCEIRASAADGRRLVVAAIGPNVAAALERSIRRLPMAGTSCDASVTLS